MGAAARGRQGHSAWLAARVAAGLNLTDAEACRAAGAELLAALNPRRGEATEKAPTMAERIVRMAEELYRFGRTDRDEPFAVLNDGSNIAIMFRGRADALRSSRRASSAVDTAGHPADRRCRNGADGAGWQCA